MSAQQASPDPVDGLTYEQARDQLAGVVRALEAGGLSLEESLALWERGEQLADRCGTLLDDAERRLERSQRSREAKSSSSE